MKFRQINEKMSLDEYNAYISTLPAVNKNKCVVRINQLSKMLLGTDGWIFFYPTNFPEGYIVLAADNININYLDLELSIDTRSLEDRVNSIGDNYNRRIQLDVNCKYYRDRLHRKTDVSFNNILDTLEAEADRINDNIKTAQDFKEFVDEICGFTYKDLMCDPRTYDFIQNRPR